MVDSTVNCKLETANWKLQTVYAFFFATFLALAGRLFPNEPLNVFPFLVFLSPLPIKLF